MTISDFSGGSALPISLVLHGLSGRAGTALATVSPVGAPQELRSSGLRSRGISLRDVVRDCEALAGLLVQQQMIVAQVPPAHMPVEALGFQVEREHVGQ